MFYGLRIGLTYEETLDMPLPLLMDLIACKQIKDEGFEGQEYNNNNLDSILAVR